MPRPDDPFLDDCHKKGEALVGVLKSVSQRFVDLTPGSSTFKGHVYQWAEQKNLLNKWISNSKDNNCDDDELPPGFSLKDAEFQAKRPSPRGTSFRDNFIDRGGYVPVGVSVVGAVIFGPVGALILATAP